MRNGAGSIVDLRHTASLPMRVGILALVVWLAAGILFLAFPGIDLEVSRLFFAGKRVFSGQTIGWVKVARNVFVAVFFASIAGTLAGLILTRTGTRRWLHLRSRQWWYLAICLAVGPGLVANVGFKNHWGRARPNEIVEFGGTKAFTPAIFPARQCASNCSFVSGEAAAAFVPFYAMGLLCPQWTTLLIALGTLSGLTAGLVRVAQGGHFLSDVVFAGIFMLLTVVVAHLALFRRRPTSDPFVAAAAPPRGAVPERSSERGACVRSPMPSRTGRRLAAARHDRRARIGQRN